MIQGSGGILKVFPPARLGLSLDNGRLTVVALTGRDRLEHFVGEGVEDPASALAAELRARELPARRIRVGLDRTLVIVKTLDLPRAGGGDLGEMVGFELERHVPFPPEEVRFDWTELPSTADQPRRVLVAACERHAVEHPLSLLAGAKRRPAALSVACHDLPALLPRDLPAQRAVWAHRHGRSTDLLFLDGRTLLMSRRVIVQDAGELAREIQRSLALVRWSHCEALWLSGDEAAAWLAAPRLAAALGAPVSPPPYAPTQAARVVALPPEGAALLALAVAAGSPRPVLNLLPAERRPWTLSRAELVTIATASLTVLLGASLLFAQNYQTERYLNRLSQEIRRLGPDVQTVEGLSAQLGRKRQLLATFQAVQADGIRALPALRELTELLPQDAWIQALSMDAQGVEITGQANAASQLIPILENSSRLAGVEFTSPVTRTQDKDQFRLKAAWKAESSAAAVPAPTVGRRPRDTTSSAPAAPAPATQPPVRPSRESPRGQQ